MRRIFWGAVLILAIFLLFKKDTLALACSGTGYTCRKYDCAIGEIEDQTKTCPYRYVCCYRYPTSTPAPTKTPTPKPTDTPVPSPTRHPACNPNGSCIQWVCGNSTYNGVCVRSAGVKKDVPGSTNGCFPPGCQSPNNAAVYDMCMEDNNIIADCSNPEKNGGGIGWYCGYSTQCVSSSCKVDDQNCIAVNDPYGPSGRRPEWPRICSSRPDETTWQEGHHSASNSTNMRCPRAAAFGASARSRSLRPPSRGREARESDLFCCPASLS